MCIGGYPGGNRPLEALRDAGRLIDCHLAPEDIPRLGIKYSCFEGLR